MHPFVRFESMVAGIVVPSLLRHEIDPSIGKQALASVSKAVREEQIDAQATLIVEKTWDLASNENMES
jgi:hypothetical protein